MIYKAERVASVEDALRLKEICEQFIAEMTDSKIDSLNKLIDSGALEPAEKELVRHSERQLNPGEGMRSTFVYLMLNKRNGYYKIGRSLRPEYREKTLQSEEPEIEMIRYWKALERHEDILHGWFRKKRIRGEWFALEEKDIQKIEKFFKSVGEL